MGEYSIYFLMLFELISIISLNLVELFYQEITILIAHLTNRANSEMFKYQL